MKNVTTFCTENGKLQLTAKGNYQQAPNQYKAWFLHKKHLANKQSIFFGHWSELKITKRNFSICLDDGYIWGGKLSAFCINNKQKYSISSNKH